ncbi:hypothetical protein [Streptomyces sp. NPDC087859]|uniref:hypothetical protein n=1 Tax=Streptomyces sp. NPDC087859 TaxID=3365812 RepID=UPI0037FF3413
MVMVLASRHRGPAKGLLVDLSRKCRTELPEVAAALVAPGRASRADSGGCGGSTRKAEGATHHRRRNRPEGEGHDSRSRCPGVA